jgi:hypothetical protein
VLSFLALTLIALVLAGCGGGGGASDPITSISLSYYYLTASGLLPITATVGDQVQMLVAGNQAQGGQVTLSSGITWHSTNPGAASVAPSGMLTANGPGSTQITATWGGFTSPPLTVTVNAAGSTPTATYYPFSLNAQWLYTGTAVAPDSVTPPVTLTITAQDQVVLEGLVWWELRVNYTDPTATPGYLYLRHDAQGLREVLYVSQGNSSVPQYSYRLEAPFTAGAHWSDPTRPTEHYWDLLSTTASVTVPAGTYHNCLQVREHDVTTDGTPFTTSVWFAATVGIVETDTPASTDVVTGVVTPDENEQLLRTQVATEALSAPRASGRPIRPWRGRSPFSP